MKVRNLVSKEESYEKTLVLKSFFLTSEIDEEDLNRCFRIYLHKDRCLKFSSKRSDLSNFKKEFKIGLK